MKEMWNVDLRLAHFLPVFLVPPNAYPPVVAGFLLLFVSIYTLTFTAPSRRVQFTLIRLAIVPPSILLFWHHGYGTSYNPPGAQVAVGMAVVSLYGIMRVIDTTIVAFVDPAPPIWVRRSDGTPFPLPTSTKERLAYTFDLATSLRGTSWFGDRYWNWAPTPLLRISTPHITRLSFVLGSVRSLITQYFLIDIFDSIKKSRTWDTSQRFPITSLSMPEQLLFSISVAAGTVFPITVMYTLVSGIAVTFGSSPSCWPPMFDRPFYSVSLADFWSRRWHAIFRRMFSRLSLLVLAVLPIPKTYYRTRTTARAVTVFALSASLHILLMYRLELATPSHASLIQTFLDPSILAFFLVQPIGLALEALVVRPIVLRVVSHENAQNILMRLWTWGFMLWAGRFWSDVWVRRGLWGETEHVVGYSLVRGLLNGQWKA